MSEASLTCLLRIKVSGPSLKVFSERYYLKAVKLWHNNKNHRLIKKKRKMYEKEDYRTDEKRFCASFTFQNKQ